MRRATWRGRKSQIIGVGKEGSSGKLLRVLWVNEWGQIGARFQLGEW